MASAKIENEAIEKVESLVELSFAKRQLKLNSAADAKEIVDSIRDTEKLHALCLEGNTLGLEAAKAIAEVLKSKGEFQKALWSDIFTGRLRSEIPPSLEFLGDGIIAAKAKLHTLDLSDNAFGPDGVKGIKKLLLSPACYSLTVLKLNNNGLGIGGGKILSQAFIDCHKSSVAAGQTFALKVFISGRNRLEDEGATALSQAFKVLGSLEEIQMPQNGIRQKGVAALSQAFQENKNLKVVNINDNTCTVVGSESLAKCLPHLAKLETLNVGDCLLKDKGAAAIAAALAADLPCLKEVIMSFNEIRREGAMAVVESMKNKRNLKLLNLDGNQLGDGVEDVQDRMAAFGLISALAPFDENEEPDSEEDDAEAAEDGASEDEEADDDLSLQIRGMGLSKDSALLSEPQTSGQSTPPASVDDVRNFLRSPTFASWQRFSRSNRCQVLEEVIKNELLPNIDKAVSAFIQVSNALSDHADSVKEASDAILRAAFTDSRCKPDDIVASILIHMGLLKSEGKLQRPVTIKGPLGGLGAVVMNEYFPRVFATHLIAFLTKPNDLLESCQSERHFLLQKLYQK